MAVNWPGLLAWSTKYHDGTKPSEFTQLSDEDRKFLEAAMEEAFGQIEDPNQVMKEAINQIKSEERTPESITTALEIIDRCCDDPDCARNVEKLGGIQTILDLLQTHDGSIRHRALEILALLLSNNPSMQEFAFKRGALDILMKLVKNAPEGSEDKMKSLRTLVSLLRQAAEQEEDFIRRRGGLSLLISCLQPKELSKTREKAASFLQSLAIDGRLQPDDCKLIARALAPLIRTIADEHVQYREIVASCGCELIRVAAAQCQPELAAAIDARLQQIPKPEGTEDADEFVSLLEGQSLLRAPAPAA